MSVLSKHKIVISRLICAPGHGKSIIDALNASSKTKLTFESANNSKQQMKLVMIQLENFQPISWLMELVFQLLLSAKECSNWIEVGVINIYSI